MKNETKFIVLESFEEQEELQSIITKLFSDWIKAK